MHFSLNEENRMKKIVTLSLALMLVLGAALFFPGCTESILGHSYDNADLYTIGNATITMPVERVSVNWTSGLVTFATHDADTVEVTETSDIELSDSMKLHWWLDGTILRIEFAASGHMEVIDMSRKTVVITLPSSLELTNVDVYTASARLEGKIATRTLNVSCTSGPLELETGASAVNISTASGDIALNHTAHAEKIMLAVASGDIHAHLTSADMLRIGAASGDIFVESSDVLSTISIGTASGDITYTTDAAPGLADFSTSSGEVNVYVPATLGFAAKIKTNGHYDSDLSPVRIDHVATYLDGAAQFDISTNSGSIGIWEKK